MLVDEFVFAANYVFFLVVEWMAWTPMAYGLDTYGLDAYKNPVKNGSTLSISAKTSRTSDTTLWRQRQINEEL